MPVAPANGIEVFHDVRGEGPPVLLVAGLGNQFHYWEDDLVDRIVSVGHRVIRFDNRDSGRSTRFAGVRSGLSEVEAARRSGRAVPDVVPYTLSDMASDAAGLLAAIDIDAAHVVGASMGGMIAQTMAIDHPGRVRSLTSIMSTTGDPTVGQPTPEMEAWLFRSPPTDRESAIESVVDYARVAHGSHFDPDRVRRRAARDIDRGSYPEGTGRQLAAVRAAPDRTPALREVTAPTLVVHGEDDPLVTVSGGRATAASVPNARLVEYAGVGHDIPPAIWDDLVAHLVAHFGSA